MGTSSDRRCSQEAECILVVLVLRLQSVACLLMHWPFPPNEPVVILMIMGTIATLFSGGE